MRAAVCTAYGPPEVVQIREVAAPAPKDDEVLIRVHATTVASGDARVRAARFPRGFALPARLALGLSAPRQPILGTECAGVIEAVGARVTRFRPGDPVFAMNGMRFGCHADLKTVRESGPLSPIPKGLNFTQAASLAFGGTTALHFLRGPGRLRRGERLLVNGASGAVGIAAVQFGRHFGAHVTAVCSATNAAVVRDHGADAVIDYRTTDLAALGERWDVIVDTVGNVSFARCRPVLMAKGRLLLVSAGLPELLAAPFQSMSNDCKVAGGTAPERAEDLALLRVLCEAGSYRAVIDSTFPLEDIVAAHRRVDSGRKVGSVVVTTA